MVNINSSMNFAKDREKRVREIQTLSFVLTDVNLYLDMYPESQEGLNYYHKYNKLYKEAVNEYEMKYGPVTPGGVKSDVEWTWIKEPWPWEYTR